jgi:hypothetical protein
LYFCIFVFLYFCIFAILAILHVFVRRLGRAIAERAKYSKQIQMR